MSLRLPIAVPTGPAAPARLPAITARWVIEVLGSVPPAEKLSTCDACVQIPAPGESRREDQYDPATKCCTYLPVLYNFQVGAILDDPDTAPEGRSSVDRRIDEGLGVLPIGLVGNEGYFANYGQETFGKDVALRCPHYLVDGGQCGVWSHRNSTCTTWFCRCDRGAASYGFWRHGLRRLLEGVEEVVSDWAVFALGAGPRDWGFWADRRAFYRASARLAAGCSWEQIVSLGGVKLQPLIEEAQELHRALLDASLEDLSNR